MIWSESRKQNNYYTKMSFNFVKKHFLFTNLGQIVYFYDRNILKIPFLNFYEDFFFPIFQFVSTNGNFGPSSILTFQLEHPSNNSKDMELYNYHYMKKLSICQVLFLRYKRFKSTPNLAWNGKICVTMTTYMHDYYPILFSFFRKTYGSLLPFKI